MPRYKVRSIPYAIQLSTSTDLSNVTVENSAGEVWNGTDNLTIFLRYKVNRSPALNPSYLFSIPATAGNNRVYIRNGLAGTVTVALGAAAVLATLQATKDAWLSIALVLDRSNSRFKIFHNGLLHTDWTAFTPGTGTADITFGNNLFDTQIPLSRQSEVRMWNRVLSDSEVAGVEFDNIVPTGNLRGEWLLNEGSGTTATDTSGRGNNGVVTGATWVTDTPFGTRSATSRRVVPRDFSSTLYLTGGITASTIAGLNTACTFSAWFNTNTLASAGRTIVENSINGSNRLTMMMDAGIVRAGYYNGTAYTSKASGMLNKDTWYHGVFTWNGTDAALYINGISQAATTPSPSSSVGGALGIGRRGDAATQLFQGSLAEVCLWNRALSTAEVEALYYTGAIPSSGLVGKYLLNEGSGATALDTSGLGNNGTITGGTYTSYAPLKTRAAVSERVT